MENTSKPTLVNDRDIFYYRQRSKNRVFEALTAFFAEEAERRHITKHDIAESLHRDPASITRWLTTPSNLTLDTISDLLLSLGAEMDYLVMRFADRGPPNEIHPLIDTIIYKNTMIQYATPQVAQSEPFRKLDTPQSNSQQVTILLS